MDEKRCKDCGVVKPLSEFYRSTGMRDGHRNDCKACNLAAKAARYAADPQKAVDRVREWQRSHPEQMAEYRRRRNARAEVKAAERAGHLRRKFGITPEHYDEVFAAQGGTCAICGAPPRDGSSLHVDHDHGSGKVRGLLCFSCNAALGHFRERQDLLAAASAYLVEHDPEMIELAAMARARLADLVASAR